MINYNQDEIYERKELIDKLSKNGYDNLIEMLLSDEKKIYTKKGRLNKSGACRALGWKPKELEDALEKCREILKMEFE